MKVEDHALACSRRRIDALVQGPGALGLGGEDRVELVETHISWVLLAGDLAYKFKKPLRLDFLDFSTLEQRRAACREELRINRRTAPDLYLDVLALTGGDEAPRLGGEGPVLDWAVRMRRFPADALLSVRAAAGDLQPHHIDALARAVAAFHGAAAVATADQPWGRSAPIRQLVRDNLPPLQARVRGTALEPVLTALGDWSEREGERLAPLFESRRAAGRVREGHGDLHLGNLIWWRGAPQLFDAIEFDPALRWIDVVADAAFLFMDLHAHGLAPLAWRFMNAYLDETGDHAGLEALAFYAAYRALVRAKVAALRVQAPGDGHDAEMARYLRLAQALTQPRERALLIAHGVSGSGKSSGSQPLIESRGVVRLRADVERKRLFGLAPEQSSAAVPGGIYTPEASARAYAELLARARTVLQAGYAVLVDATFLKRAHRAPFVALAHERGVPCRVLAFEAPPDVLRERVRRRAAEQRDASEATEAVLEQQLIEVEAPTENEGAPVLRVCTQQRPDWDALLGPSLADAAPDHKG